MQDLLSAASILLTDYSSCMFDMAIAEKKCFIHAQDLNEYLTTERELYFNIKELPFNFSTTDKQLVSNIMNFNESEYSNKLKKFNKELNNYEKGNASKRITEIITNVINN